MTTTPAGWYPDPYGSPLLRWWDGSQWTDATHAREATASPPEQPTAPLRSPLRSAQPGWGSPEQSGGPSQGFGTPPHGAGGHWPQGGYSPQGYGPYGFGGPSPKSPAIWPWITGSIAVVVALVVAITAVVFFTQDRTTTASQPVPAPLDSIVPPEQGPQDAPPGVRLPQPANGRISDTTSGLSYAFPGGDWSVPTTPQINDPTNPQLPVWTSACLTVAQENYDGQGDDWIASIYTGPLAPAVPYGGPRDLQSTTKSLLNAYEQLFYSPPHERKILSDKAMDVSGHKAWILEFDMDFSKTAQANGWKWQTEKGAFVLVDRGQGQRPSLLYVSVPDNLDQSVLDRVVHSLEAR
ncbi:hypothetical protein Pth03_51180 [Planotetraspora thailandica]|uniref:DUF2510 domain-containing protein n=1 Tax=Planotetraspora thailandica TaxID=487172 RepID=A0A8J3V9S0_9ACTN|nr:DUF2510 domain-containing protein [Planotetraspora thailandica]GII56729.1 hypothetical protein Pth03_51180 [Planotetraspora thailandica]